MLLYVVPSPCNLFCRSSSVRLKISGPKFLRFWKAGVVKIFSQRMTDSVSQLIIDNSVCRTVPATLGQLNSYAFSEHQHTIKNGLNH